MSRIQSFVRRILTIITTCLPRLGYQAAHPRTYVRRFLLIVLMAILPLQFFVFSVPTAFAATMNSGWWDGSPNITQDFGCESGQNELDGAANGCTTTYWHSGIDIGLGCNANLYTPVDGVKIIAIGGGSNNGTDTNTDIKSGLGPNYPTLLMPDGNLVLLGHVNTVTAPLNTPLARHTLITTVGNHGYSFGCHLHFEVRPAGTPANANFTQPNSQKGYAIDPHVELTQPGGWWLGPTPSDGAKALISPFSLPVNVHAQDYTGTGISHVDISWETEGGNQWSKQTQWASLSPLTFSNDVSYNIPSPVGGWPSSEIISFDVYANNGQVNFAPQGMRRVCLSNAVSCSPVTVTPPSGGNKGGGGGQPSTTCTPGSNQVALFTSTNYGGQCVVEGIGSYPDPSSVGLPNDSIQSVESGGGINIEMCRDANFSNTCEWTTTSIPDLSTHSVGSNQISSVNVQGGYAQSGGCTPGVNEVSFFVDANYGGQCVTKEFGTYNDPGAIALPNDSISSLRAGSSAKVEVCRDNNLSNTCEWIEQDVPDLGTHSVGSDQISSAYVFLRGGISLCDGTNYTGNCRVFSDGTTNLTDYGWANRARSVLFSGAYANHYHIVLWTGTNQTGGLYHADNSVADLGNPYDGNIQSINIYPHLPPGTPSSPTPADGTSLPATTTSVALAWNGADQNQVHVWGPNGYDFTQSWAAGPSSLTLNSLQPGQYFWQTQSQNDMGPGSWSDIWSFTIANPIPQPASCAPNWTCQDINNDGNQSPVTSYSNGTWTTQGSGSDVWGTTDHFHYNSLPLTGDGYISAQLLSQTNSSDWAKTGPMIRNSTADNAAFYFPQMTPSNGISVQYRTANGVVASSIDGYTPPFALPFYLKASRSGNQYSSYISQDGTSWTLIPNSTVTISGIGANALQGLAVTSHDGSQISTAVYANVSLVQGSSQSPSSVVFEDFKNGIGAWWQGGGPVALGNSGTTNFLRFTPASGSSAESNKAVNAAVLANYTSITVNINLNGATLLGNDASALYLNQGSGWKYISLSDYVQQGLTGWQTVTIPLTAFSGFDKAQSFSTLGFRFWVNNASTIDIGTISFNP